MIHAFRLIEATGLADEASRLWGAVYLHDLARTHDGFDEVHGMHAVMRVNESTDLQERLIARGVQSDDPSMLLAVMMHCLPDDHSAYGGKPIWPLLSLLKDADALDRVRFGDLEPSYLRWEPTKKMVQFAQDLYNQTRRIKEGQNHFTEVLRVAERLLGKPVPVPASVLGLPAAKGKTGKGGAAKAAAKSEPAKPEPMKAALAKGKVPPAAPTKAAVAPPRRVPTSRQPRRRPVARLERSPRRRRSRRPKPRPPRATPAKGKRR